MSAAVAENISGPENNSENSIQNGNSQLANLVKESTEFLNNAKIQPPKRGPGRPPGTGKNQRAAAESAASTDSTGPAHVSVPPPDISEFLVPPILVLGGIPAARHKMPELALTPDQAVAVATSLQQVLNAFVPDISKMNPKTAAMISFGIVVGGITMEKMQIYASKKQEQLDQQIQADQAAAMPPPPKPGQPFAEPTPVTGSPMGLFKNLEQ